MRLSPADELTLLNYFNALESTTVDRFALWKIEPDGALVFINDGPTNGNFSKEKTEAEIQIGRSALNNDLKTRAINSLVGFAGQKTVVGVAIRDTQLVQEISEAVKKLSKSLSSSHSKKVTH